MSIEDPRLSSIDNTSAADDFDSAVEQHLGYASETVGGIEVAQAETPDATRTDRLPAQTPPVEVAAATIPTEVKPNEQNVVTLPAGIELDNLEFEVDGENLVLVLADGTEIVVLGGAANIPTFVIGDVELPQVALFAALEGSNINVAAGPDGTFSAQGTPSASRNFNDDPIDAGPEDLALADLLGDTSFGDELRTGVILGAEGDTEPTFFGAAAGSVDEDYLENGNLNDGANGNFSFRGSLGINWGPDNANGLGNAGLTLADDRGVAFTPATLNALAARGYTSDGIPLVYELSANGTILTAYKDNGEGEAEEVFVVSVSDIATNGSYTFTLLGNLDHPEGQSENNIVIQFPFTAQDSDGSRASSSFTVTVNDDSPLQDEAGSATLTEDNVSEYCATDDTPGNATKTESISLGISWGADDDLRGKGDDVGRIVRFVALSDGGETIDPDLDEPVEQFAAAVIGNGRISDPASVGLSIAGGTFTSEGLALEYALMTTENGGQTLTAYIVGTETKVFEIVLDPTATNGSATVEIFQELDHNVGSNSAIISVQFQATDSDGDAAKPATFSVTIQDDVLEIGRPEREFVDEDGYPGLESGAGNPGPWGHHSDDSNGGTSERGDLNISWGADDSNVTANGGVTGAKGDRGVAFAGAEAPEGVTSNGFGLFYAYNATRTELVAYRVDSEGYFIDTNGDRIPASSSKELSLLSSAEGDEGTVEFLRLDEGEFPAEAVGQLTGAAVFEVTLSDTGSGSYTFTLLDNLDHRSQGEDNLDLNFSFTASDADGDEASLSFTVVVDDDTPVFFWFPEEEEVAERFIGETGDVERGNLYVSWGADNANSDVDGGLADGKGDRYIVFREQSAPQNLTSNGFGLAYVYGNNGTELVAYRVNGFGQLVDGNGELVRVNENTVSIIDGVLPEGSEEAAGRAAVFEVTLSDQGSGSYTFTLIDNLDHVGWGQGNEIDLKFGFKAVDSDGDILNGSFEVDVRDGGPSLGSPVSASVVDEEAVTGRDGNQGDSYSGKTGAAADAPSAGNSTGNVALNINWGNDSDLKSEPLGNGQVDDPIGRQVEFVDFRGNGVPVGTISSHNVGHVLGQSFVGLKSGDQFLSYKVDRLLDAAGNWNGGYVLTASAGHTPVFTVTLDPTSETGSYKFDLLGVLNHPNKSGVVNSENDIDLTFRFKAIDSDGDATNVGSFKVTVDDDAPVASVAVVSNVELRHDETGGAQEGTDDKSETLLSVFNGLGDAIGWAQQAGMVSTSASSYGADGAGSTTLALTQANGSTFNGVDSGLQNLEGQIIQLVSQGSLVLGKVGSVVYFALSIDNSGTVSIAQYQPIKHDPNSSANDLESILNLHVTATVTDRDGDVSTTTTSAPLDIKIVDDGLSVATSNPLLHVVDEDGLQTAAPDSVEAIANGTAVAGGGSPTASIAVGSLKSLFNFGADGAHATEAISLKAATNVPTDLTSQSKPILISVSSDGKTLTGTADGREVFTLKLNAEGTSYTFELKDQIDHPTLNNVASGSDGAFNDAENLLSSGTPSSLLDLSQFIVGKDGDGDTVTLTAGKFVIDVRDDIPTVTSSVVEVKIDTPQIVAPVEGKVANFVLVLDTSGSVTVAALKLQVTNFLSQLADSDAQDVRVHIVQFNNTASPVGTFDLIVDGEENGAALTQALAAVNGLSGGGATNYEAGLLKAVEWIDGSNTLEVDTRSSGFDATNGSSYDQAYIIGNGSTQIAMVSGWQEPGNTVSSALNANGDNSNGWGVGIVGDANIDDGQILRFDFGAFNDFDSQGGFENARNFNGIPVKSATFSLDDNNGSSSPTLFEYTVYFVGGGSATATVSVNNNDTSLTIAGAGANLGKQIAYIEFTTSGQGRGSVDLESVATPGPLLAADVNKVIFLSDGQPNAALDNSGNPFSTSPTNAINESLNEIGAIENDADGVAGPQQSFSIEAFGINVGAAALENLEDVSGSTGNATNLVGSNTLAGSLQGLLNSLAGTPGSAAPTSANFNLSPLVSVGADEGLTFSMKSGTSGLPVLQSGGVTLVYTVANNILTATAGETGPTVFTLSLAANGSGTFTLNKPIDGQGDRDVDFSSLIQAQDFDGDAVSLAPGKFVVTVDGVPSGAPQTFETKEDESFSGTIAAIIGDDGVGTNGGFVIADKPAIGTVDIDPKTGAFTYIPKSNWSGTETFSVTVTDDDGDVSAPIVVTVIVAAVADAPSLTVSSAIADEDTGIFLSVSSSLTDTDGSETLKLEISDIPVGAKLTGASGQTFTAIAGSTTANITGWDLSQLKITPPANSDDDFTLKVRATSTEAVGGDTEVVTKDLAVSVTAVADAPSLTVSSAIADEDTGIFLSVSSSLTDTDGSETLKLEISDIPAGAVLTDGTKTFTATGSSSVANITGWTLSQLKITPPANSDDDFTLKVHATSTEAVGGDTEVVTKDLAVSVTAVADAPSLTVSSAIADEDTGIFLSVSSSLTDTDGSETLKLEISDIPVGAKLTGASGQTFTAIAGSTTANITGWDLSQLKITPPANSDDDFTLKVHATSTEAVGGDTEVVTKDLAVSVTAVNDAPTSSNDDVKTDEDTAKLLSVSDFGSYSDVEGTALAAVKITSLASDGKLQYFNGSTWVDVTLNQEVSVADIDGNKLRFAPDANESGNPYATIGFKVGDGAAFSENAYTLTVKVDPRDDGEAPIDISNSTAPGQTPKVGDVLQASVGTDPDGGNGASVTYKWYRGDVEISGATGTTYKLTDADAGKPITVKANYTDGQGFIENIASAPTANVVSGNVAPTGKNNTVNLVEDVTYTFKASDFGFQDADGHAFAGITVTPPAGAAAGKLMLGNTQISSSQFVSAEQIAAGMLTWAPADNKIGSNASTLFTFKVKDSSGAEDPIANEVRLQMPDTDLADFEYQASYAWYGLIDEGDAALGVGPGRSSASIIQKDSGTEEINFGDTGAAGDIFTELNFVRSDNNLEITVTTQGATRVITVLNQYEAGNTVWERVEFNEGVYAGYNFAGTYNLDADLTGGNGNDVVAGSSASETLSGGDGKDLLFGNGGNDTVTGGAGDDLILGGLGNDRIAGGSGNDTLVGGAGADTFVWSEVYSNSNSAMSAVRDVISDYNLSQGDVIELQGLASSRVDDVKVVTSGSDLLVQVSGRTLYTLQGAATAGVDKVFIKIDGTTYKYGDNNTRTEAADPIILDLDKNGFAFSSIGDGVTFDIDADGHKDQIAWTSDDGILAYDVDGNGLIDNGSEIFTPDFNGGKFASGVAALASLDSNKDGKIDASDDAFSKLQVWVDADNDGISDDGELSSLSANGVASISLTTDQTGGEEDGQTVFAEGEFTFADGSTGNFLEVGFDTIFGSENDGLTLHGGMGEVVMTGSAGADTFVFDGTALDELDVADVITDFSTEEGDVLDVTALLDSLLGEQPDATVETHLRATVDEGNTTVSVQTAQDTWKDVVVLQNHDTAIKVLFDDKHAVVTPHD